MASLDAVSDEEEKLLTEYTIQDVEKVKDLDLALELAKCHIQNSEFYQKQAVNSNEKLLQITKEYTQKYNLNISGIIPLSINSLPIEITVDRQFNTSKEPNITAIVDEDVLTSILDKKDIEVVESETIWQIKPEEYRIEDVDKYDKEMLIRIIKYQQPKQIGAEEIHKCCECGRTKVSFNRKLGMRRWYKQRSKKDNTWNGKWLCNQCNFNDYDSEKEQESITVKRCSRCGTEKTAIDKRYNKMDWRKDRITGKILCRRCDSKQLREQKQIGDLKKKNEKADSIGTQIQRVDTTCTRKCCECEGGTTIDKRGYYLWRKNKIDGKWDGRWLCDNCHGITYRSETRRNKKTDIGKCDGCNSKNKKVITNTTDNRLLCYLCDKERIKSIKIEKIDRKCCKCGEGTLINNRGDAAWARNKVDGKWNGQWLCASCYGKIYRFQNTGQKQVTFLKKVKEKRVCCECGSDKTRIDKKGDGSRGGKWEQWFRNKLVEGQWFCDKCHKGYSNLTEEQKQKRKQSVKKYYPKRVELNREKAFQKKLEKEITSPQYCSKCGICSMEVNWSREDFRWLCKGCYDYRRWVENGKPRAEIMKTEQRQHKGLQALYDMPIFNFEQLKQEDLPIFNLKQSEEQEPVSEEQEPIFKEEFNKEYNIIIKKRID